MKNHLVLAALGSFSAALLQAQSTTAPTTDSVEKLPEFTVYSPRVANQVPAASFAMPISALKFDPKVDVQARNLAEAQADVSIRGGTFESTGFKLGSLNLYDPQTGHYFAEIPVAPAMLGAPEILTGVENAESGFNAGTGTVSYGWREISTNGFGSVGFGDNQSQREELYQGVSTKLGQGLRLGTDFSFAHSKSDGPIAYGDHDFYRYSGRIQLVSPLGQTDLIAGYQSKFFGWPNMYTPFNVDETEDLQTVLFALNHRKSFGGGDYVEAGVFWRRNKDDYEFNRFIPGLYNPYKHTTWVYGTTVEGRSTLSSDALWLNYGAHAMFDTLESTSLVYGPFRHRDYYKLSLVPEYQTVLDDHSKLDVQAGMAYDDTNKGSSAGSPVFEVARLNSAPDAILSKLYLSYAKTTQVASYTALKSSPKSGLFRGNASLDRSSSNNLELGDKLNLSSWQFTSALFWRHDDRLVDWTYSYASTAARTANTVNLDTTGVELGLSRSWKKIDLMIGYTGLSKYANYRNAAVDASFYAMNYPKHRLTTALVARLGAGFELRLDNEARLQQDNPLRKLTRQNALMSSFGICWKSTALEGFQVYGVVDNLWNTDFQDIPATPASPRQFSAGVQYAW